MHRAVEDVSTGSDSDYSRCVRPGMRSGTEHSDASIAQYAVTYRPKTHNVAADNALGQWISWFLSSKGNEYFCEVDEDFILDRFNLTGLNGEVSNYPQALDLITDNLGAIPTFLSLMRMLNTSARRRGTRRTSGLSRRSSSSALRTDTRPMDSNR
jgi:hypothetical protein